MILWIVLMLHVFAHARNLANLISCFMKGFHISPVCSLVCWNCLKHYIKYIHLFIRADGWRIWRLLGDHEAYNETQHIYSLSNSDGNISLMIRSYAEPVRGWDLNPKSEVHRTPCCHAWCSNRICVLLNLQL